MLNETVAYEMMGPGFLAAQDITPEKDLPFKKDDNWADLFAHLEANLYSMKTWRWSWWSHWTRLAEFFRPRRMHWFITPNRYGRGHGINDAIIDGSPTLALNVCSSGMWAGLTNPARPWFRIEPRDPQTKLDAEGQKWVDDLVQAVFAVMERSNFYTTMAQGFEDVALFGTSPIIIYEDDQKDAWLYLPCAGEYFLKVGSRFTAETLCREFLLNVMQIVEMFSFENCPAEIQGAFREGGARLNEEFAVCHMIEPNYTILSRSQGGKKINVLPGSFTYREVYWLRGKQSTGPLSKRGFNDAPFFTLYWSRVANDPYGRSPCMDALGDNKQIQRETLRKGEFIDKMVNPPMGADPKLKNEPQSLLPGKINYINTANGKNSFFPLFEMQATGLTAIGGDIEMVSKRIDRALFVDVFMAITNMEGVEPRNELELTKRDLERLQKLGPVINLVENALADAILRFIGILERRKRVMPPPPAMKNLKLKMTFESINRLAQRASESMAMKDTFATLGELSSAAKAAQVPDPIRTFNLDRAARKYAMSNNFPSDCIFTEEEIKQHDAARQAIMAKQQAPQLAMAGVQAAKTLSETQVPGGNALGAILGGQGGGR